MLDGSIPNSCTAIALVESATKCLAMCAWSFAVFKNHVRAERALVIVSWVVNVLDATMNRVVSGLHASKACAKCVPSMLETK